MGTVHMKETEIAKPIIQWLNEQNWTVYQEVQFTSGGCIADIVAERHNILWIIETKLSYGLAVLEQATRWPVHYRSVGVPWAKDRDYKVAQYYYKVGVIEVMTDYSQASINERIKSPLFAKNYKTTNRYKSVLTELHKTFAEAGSKGSQHLTPYKQTMIEVKRVIERNPGCTIQFLYETLGKMHYASSSSFKGNLIKSLWEFEKDWCVIDTKSRPYKLFIKSD